MFHRVISQLLGRKSGGLDEPVRVSDTGNLETAGDVAHDAVDSGKPVAQGFQARTTNPTAVGDADRVRGIADDVGRQIVWPFQVRDLMATASATLTSGTAATFLAAGGAGVFHDCVHLSFANQSTAAANIALLADGSVIKTVQVPAANTLSIDLTSPLLQPTANTVWTVDMEDITGTTVIVDGTFVKNV